VFHQGGWQDEEFISCPYHGADGTLYCGGNNGFNSFFTGSDHSPAAPPAARGFYHGAKLNRTIAAQEFRGRTDALALAYDESSTLTFCRPRFTSPAKQSYSYQLESCDSGWIDGRSLPRATYTKRDAGTTSSSARRQCRRLYGAILELPFDACGARSLEDYGSTPVYFGAGLLVFGYLGACSVCGWNANCAIAVSWSKPVPRARMSSKSATTGCRSSSRARATVVARMRHERLTPMNVVLGNDSLLLDTRIDPCKRRFAAAIHRPADSLLAIVDDVFSTSPRSRRSACTRSRQR